MTPRLTASGEPMGDRSNATPFSGDTGPTVAAKSDRVVAIVGNPNTGKSTLFNALTGYHQRIGNYPGVTVDRRTGTLRGHDSSQTVELIDLPGAYSLGARGADEAVVLDVLLGGADETERVDLIVIVVNAANLGRNLFLATQVLELERPAVVALNMIDAAAADGIDIDADALSRELGVPVVPLVATKQGSAAPLIRAIIDSLDAQPSSHCANFPKCVCAELDGLTTSLAYAGNGCGTAGARAEALQTLLDPGGYQEQRLIARCGRGLADELARRRERILEAGESLVEVEARVRYAWIGRVVDGVVRRAGPARRSRSEQIDRVLTHRFVGIAILMFMLAGCFQAIYSWASPLIDGIDGTFGLVGGWVSSWMPPGPLESLLVNGVLAGVGAVLVFLPQILILFLFIAVLEDCGYMARAAFLLDRWMSRIGLNGKSFIPLLSSFACAVPGILAARTIEDRRDRFVTILIAPLMSCSARLPVYILLIGAFIPATPLLGRFLNAQAATLFVLYGVGMAVAIPIALLLKRSVLKGEAPSFLMELPTYRCPSLKTVFYRVYEQGREFCKTAGTIIFAVTIVIWALGYYPRPASVATTFEAQRVAAQTAFPDQPELLDAQLSEINSAEAGAYLRQSILGRMGRWIEPVVEPIGWDWRIGTAVIAAFPAREVMIATMGTIYNLGENQDETSRGLRDKLRAAKWPDGRPVFSIPVALSIMVFFALCCQCGATLAVIRRETRSWTWPVATFAYMTGLAYVAAFATYQIALRVMA